MSKSTLLVALFLIGTFFISIQMVQSAKADTISGTSPEFIVNQIYYVNLTGLSVGKIVEYNFFSDDYLEFRIDGPNGLVHYYYPFTYDVSESFGFYVDTPGTYSFQWTNHNFMNTAIVTYSIDWFTPNIELTSPMSGSLIHDLNPNLIGTCDQSSLWVNVSVNNLTFYPAQKQGGNWMANLQLQAGANNVFVAADYKGGVRFVRQFSLTTGFGLDFSPHLEMTSPEPGSLVRILNPTLTGTCDDNATAVSLSKNNITFSPAQKQGMTWSSQLQLDPGMNDIFVKATYIRGDFSYSYSRSFEITTGFGLDFQPYLDINSPAPGTIFPLLNPTIGGTCDDNASTISVSTNNITFAQAQKQGTSWVSSVHLVSGQNTIFVKAVYVRGDFSYTYPKSFALVTGFGLNFVPNIELTSPRAGSTITDLTPFISGQCDENASWVVYSLNNFTFYSTDNQGPNWISSTASVLQPGQNTIYVKATYQRGDFWYNYTKAFSVNVDTTWVYQKDGNTNLGIGAIAAIMAAIVIVAIIGVVLIQRSRKKKP